VLRFSATAGMGFGRATCLTEGFRTMGFGGVFFLTLDVARVGIIGLLDSMGLPVSGSNVSMPVSPSG